MGIVGAPKSFSPHSSSLPFDFGYALMSPLAKETKNKSESRMYQDIERRPIAVGRSIRGSNIDEVRLRLTRHKVDLSDICCRYR